MEFKASQISSTLEIFKYLRSENLKHDELGSEHIGQVLTASLAVHTYVIKNGRIQNLLFHPLCVRNFPVILLSSARVVQFVIECSQAKAHKPYKMRMPTAF